MPNKTPREIVLAAFNYLAEISPPTQKISGVRVEEVKMIENGTEKIWSVILSYDNVGDFIFEKTREYKKFSISDNDGRVLSMERLSKE